MKKLLMSALILSYGINTQANIIASKGTMNMSGNKMVLSPSMYYSVAIKNNSKAQYFVEMASSRSRYLINPGKSASFVARTFDFPVSLKSLIVTSDDFTVGAVASADATSTDKSSMVSTKTCSETEQEVYFSVTKVSSGPNNTGTRKIAQMYQFCKPQKTKKSVTLRMTIQSSGLDLAL
jgi:hypothetical protein